MSQPPFYQLDSQDQFNGWNYLPLLLDVISVFAFAVQSLPSVFTQKSYLSEIFLFTIIRTLDAKQ